MSWAYCDGMFVVAYVSSARQASARLARHDDDCWFVLGVTAEIFESDLKRMSVAEMAA